MEATIMGLCRGYIIYNWMSLHHWLFLLESLQKLPSTNAIRPKALKQFWAFNVCSTGAETMQGALESTVSTLTCRYPCRLQQRLLACRDLGFRVGWLGLAVWRIFADSVSPLYDTRH